jgi:hypothetical protein
VGVKRNIRNVMTRSSSRRPFSALGTGPAIDQLTLGEVQRRLDSMLKARLLSPFNEDERRHYAELLEVERKLMTDQP